MKMKKFFALLALVGIFTFATSNIVIAQDVTQQQGDNYYHYFRVVKNLFGKNGSVPCHGPSLLSTPEWC